MADELTPTTPSAEPVAFHFDRYVNGVLMAQCVVIERAATLEAATAKAAKIAPRGPDGEVPVLVLAHSPTDTVRETLRHVTDLLVAELGNLADEDDTDDEDLAAVIGDDYAKHVIACRLRIRQARVALGETK